eukprot:5493362-Amphidinium_carterae.1
MCPIAAAGPALIQATRAAVASICVNNRYVVGLRHLRPEPILQQAETPRAVKLPMCLNNNGHKIGSRHGSRRNSDDHIKQ